MCSHFQIDMYLSHRQVECSARSSFDIRKKKEDLMTFHNFFVLKLFRSIEVIGFFLEIRVCVCKLLKCCTLEMRPILKQASEIHLRWCGYRTVGFRWLSFGERKMKILADYLGNKIADSRSMCVHVSVFVYVESLKFLLNPNILSLSSAFSGSCKTKLGHKTSFLQSHSFSIIIQNDGSGWKTVCVG